MTNYQEIKVSVTLNRPNFLHHVIEIKRKASAENWACLEQKSMVYFFRIDDCGPFEGSPGANVSNALLLNMTLPGSSTFLN